MPSHLFCVHGCDGITNLGPYSWTKFLPMARAAGHIPYAPSMSNDNLANARDLRTLISDVPLADPVWLIGHSMGCLSTRQYLKYLGGAERVAGYIGLDGPQYGVSWWKSMMLNRNDQVWSGSSFIKALNEPDETPGTLPYVQLILDYTQLLPGVLWKNVAREGVDHRSVVGDEQTLDLILRIVGGDYSELT